MKVIRSQSEGRPVNSDQRESPCGWSPGQGTKRQTNHRLIKSLEEDVPAASVWSLTFNPKSSVCFTPSLTFEPKNGGSSRCFSFKFPLISLQYYSKHTIFSVPGSSSHHLHLQTLQAFSWSSVTTRPLGLAFRSRRSSLIRRRICARDCF